MKRYMTQGEGATKAAALAKARDQMHSCLVAIGLPPLQDSEGEATYTRGKPGPYIGGTPQQVCDLYVYREE